MASRRPEPAVAHAVQDCRIHQVTESAAAWSRSIRDLFGVYPHNRQLLEATRMGPVDLAVVLGRSLPETDGVLVLAEEHKRLIGLVDLHPEPWPSAALGHSMWTLRHLILDPSAPDNLSSLLVQHACDGVDGQTDFVTARPPASDAAAIRALQSAGFEVVGGETVGVIRGLDTSVPRLASMSFGPLEPAQLEAACALANVCSRSMSYSLDPTFEPERLADLMHRRLAGCIRDDTCGTVAAMNKQGKLLGLLGHSRDTRLEAYLGRRLAKLDFVGVTPRHRGEGICALLLQHTLARLGRQGIEGVVARVVMHENGPINELAALHKLGFTIAGTNLVMHRWARAEDRPRPRPADNRTAHPAPA